MKTERGQALILIAFGIAAILGMTALAIDGGNAFADRRHAQNAVDNAALSAALAILNSQDGQTAAEALIISNGYDIVSDRSEMLYEKPPISGPYAGNDQYVQVMLTSIVDTWFARIVGVEQMTNRVEAVARAKPWTPYFFGDAVVSLSPGDGKTNTHEFIYGGSASVMVEGSGIFINANDGACPVTNTGAAVSLEIPDGGITTVASCNGTTQIGTQFEYPPSFPEFENLCDPNNDRNVELVSGNFPKNNTPEQLQNDTIYCISGDFKVTSSNTKLYGSQVTFVVQGNVEIQGGQLNLTSPPDLPLFYLPYADSRFNPQTGEPNSKVKINGNSDILLKGMVLAPASPCDINGTNGTGLYGQLVCYTVTLTGGSQATVVYNDGDNPDDPPIVELTQ